MKKLELTGREIEVFKKLLIEQANSDCSDLTITELMRLMNKLDPNDNQLFHILLQKKYEEFNNKNGRTPFALMANPTAIDKIKGNYDFWFFPILSSNELSELHFLFL